ncbi:MAG: HAMP domain-containing histidine kinase [Lachnospiraceae bacterium]|nr:HAMP domain-containing histidine kinase [Lachnospiraceae bacterium]MDE6253392.1 HAMP domain-containing histidine kinase [Lachnospiraceae bacterium]
MGNLRIKMTLKKSLILYTLIALLAAFLSGIVLFSFFEKWKIIIADVNGVKVKFGRNRTMVFTNDIMTINTIKAIKQIKLVNIIEVVSIILCVVISVIMLVRQYYKRILEEPISILKQEAEYIGRNDLSFECSYISMDEMGDICRSFNDMRLKLIDNQKKTWELIEAQRQLNAAFAHDIRTPVTIIKGYAQMLLEFYASGSLSEEKLEEILNTFLIQADRAERFSLTMKEIHSMEEWNVDKKKMSFQSIAEQLKSGAEGMSNDNISIKVHYKNDEREMFCDINLINEVADNLVSNALRYAVENIEVSIEAEDDTLYLYVKDDGKGFTKDTLYKASRPYFTTEKNHFGLGLAICETLCKKHGGNIELINSINGGAIAAAYFICI